MEKKLVMLLLFCSSVLGFAQHGDPNSMATFGLISSFLNQRWNVGYMHKITDNIWLGSDVGYGAKGMVLPLTEDVISYQSFEIRPAFYYSLAPESRVKHFVGAEFFHISTEKREDNFHFWDNNLYYWADAGTMNRRKTGGNVTYSVLLHGEKSRIAFMPKIGVGIRNLKINYTDSVNVSESSPPTDGFPPFSNSPREGNGFNFDLDIKLVYKF